MANVTTRRRGEILRNLFQILEQQDEGLQAKDAIAQLESMMELTDFEKSRFPNNPDLVRFPKIVRFATIASVKAGWLRKRSGTWTLTEDGKEALHAFPDPEKLLSLIEPSDVGVYISLGSFTSDCAALGRRTSRRVTLIDGDELLKLWFEYFERIDEDGRQLLPIKPVYYLDPSASST